MQEEISNCQRSQRQSQAFTEIMRWCPELQSDQPLPREKVRFAPLHRSYQRFCSWLVVCRACRAPADKLN